MSESVTIRTPESIEVRYNLAGYGSRLMAGLLDYFIVAALILLATLLMSLVVGLFSWVSEALNDWIISFAAAAYVLVGFLVFWGYFIFFEMVWNGQTPAKRILGLRTIREGGFELGFFASVSRNLVRVADMLPLFYLVGFMTMILNKRCKRLGDFAAGTLVIREQELLTPQAWSMDQGRYNTYLEDSSMVQKIRAQISHNEFETLKDLYVRRDSLQVDMRMRLDRELYNFLIEKLGLPPDPLISHEQAIRNVLEIRRQAE